MNVYGQPGQQPQGWPQQQPPMQNPGLNGNQQQQTPNHNVKIINFN